jgi:translation initiation factor 1
MAGLFDGTPLERPVTCAACGRPLDECDCPRDASGDVLRPCDQTAVIRLERRKNGRTVTAVSGLDPVANDLPGLLRSLKSACAAGGAVADAGVEVQGDHRPAARALLEELGYRVREEAVR